MLLAARSPASPLALQPAQIPAREVAPPDRAQAPDSVALLPLDALATDRPLLRGWVVRAVRGALAPELSIIDSAGTRALRLAGVNRAAWFVRELDAPISPTVGSLTWSWRVLKHPGGADLRRRDADDAALRVFVVFERASRFDRVPHTLFYSSGTVEGTLYQRRSFQSSGIHVIRMGGPGTDGQWLRTAVDPFADHQRVWGGTARAIVAIGIMQDSEQTMSDASADVRALVWRRGNSGLAP